MVSMKKWRQKPQNDQETPRRGRSVGNYLKLAALGLVAWALASAGVLESIERSGHSPPAGVVLSGTALDVAVQPEFTFTLTPVPTATPQPTNTTTPAPTEVPPTAVPHIVTPQYTAPVPAGCSMGRFYWDCDPVCLVSAERWNWEYWARSAGFPEYAMAELAYIISKESGGDLCAVNNDSGATCWIQQHYGGPEFLDPATCMAQGYAKWFDGGGGFERHWYRFW